MRILLASKSPRRIALLRAYGVELCVRPADIDESAIHAPTPPSLVCALAKAKAGAIAPFAEPGEIIVAADTVVALQNRILGKPADEADARAMLTALSGQTHQVYTGLCVMKGDTCLCESVSAHVTFRTLTEAEIDAYLKTGEPMDKAGAYGIQGLGGLFVRQIEGDYYAIVGLPLCRLSELLTALGQPSLLASAPTP